MNYRGNARVQNKKSIYFIVPYMRQHITNFSHLLIIFKLKLKIMNFSQNKIKMITY